MQSWTDYKLTWNASDYGGVSSISVPASSIWIPDIVLYNRSAQQTLLDIGIAYYKPTVLYNVQLCSSTVSESTQSNGERQKTVFGVDRTIKTRSIGVA